MQPPSRVKEVVFGNPRELGLVLGSDDPLDQLWLKLDADGDGQLGRREIEELLLMMGRVTETTSDAAQLVSTVMEELDSDGSGDVATSASSRTGTVRSRSRRCRRDTATPRCASSRRARTPINVAFAAAWPSWPCRATTRGG